MKTKLTSSHLLPKIESWEKSTERLRKAMNMSSPIKYKKNPGKLIDVKITATENGTPCVTFIYAKKNKKTQA